MMKTSLCSIGVLLVMFLPSIAYSQTFYGDTIWTRDYSSNPANSAAFSPDGTKLAVSYDCLGPVVRVLNVSDGSVAWQTETPDLCLLGIQFSSNGQYIAIAEELGHLTVIDITIPDTIYDIDTQTGGLWAVDFSPSGDTIYASGSDGSVRVYETATGSLLHIVTAHNWPVLSIDVSKTGRYLATGSADSTIKIFDLENNYALMHTFTSHNGDVKVVKFIPDENRLLSGSIDRKINVHLVGTGMLDTILAFHNLDVNSIDVSSDGSFAVSGSNDQSAWMFNLNNYDSVSMFTNLIQTRVNGVAISPDMTKLAATNHIGGLIMYNITALIGFEEELVKPLLVYPNPATDFIRIANLAEVVNFELIDLKGQVVQDGLTSNTIDISLLPIGVFVLHVGNRFSKIIKQ